MPVKLVSEKKIRQVLTDERLDVGARIDEIRPMDAIEEEVRFVKLMVRGKSLGSESENSVQEHVGRSIDTRLVPPERQSELLEKIREGEFEHQPEERRETQEKIGRAVDKEDVDALVRLFKEGLFIGDICRGFTALAVKTEKPATRQALKDAAFDELGKALGDPHVMEARELLEAVLTLTENKGATDAKLFDSLLRAEDTLNIGEMVGDLSSPSYTMFMEATTGLLKASLSDNPSVQEKLRDALPAMTECLKSIPEQRSRNPNMMVGYIALPLSIVLADNPDYPSREEAQGYREDIARFLLTIPPTDSHEPLITRARVFANLCVMTPEVRKSLVDMRQNWRPEVRSAAEAAMTRLYGRASP